ncbi:MAG: hypothetical protein IJ417_01110 [Bacteroidaceae bacterium]|nr:hypothetical protein [Bacteroidaceae bacterium]
MKQKIGFFLISLCFLFIAGFNTSDASPKNRAKLTETIVSVGEHSLLTEVSRPDLPIENDILLRLSNRTNPFSRLQHPSTGRGSYAPSAHTVRLTSPVLHTRIPAHQTPYRFGRLARHYYICTLRNLLI